MSQTILSILGTSTPVSEQVAKVLGLVKAAIVCRVFFYQQLKDGVCRASNKSFQDSLGISGGAVSSNLKWLLENGWIINERELVKGNRPNYYKVTQKFYDLLERSSNERDVQQVKVDVQQVNGKEELKEKLKENTPDGKNDKPDLTEHEQDELLVFGLYGNSRKQPPDDSIEAEIINSGWLVESPLVLQALIKFLLACREVGLGLQIPNSDSRRGDWFSHLSAHVDDFGIDELAERYQAVLTRAKDEGWLNKIGRPGSLDKTLSTVQLANGHNIVAVY